MRHALCAQVSTNIALVKNATLHGVFWGSYMQHKPRVLRRSLEQLIAWLGEGRISIPIFHRRAWCTAHAAQCRVASPVPTCHMRACVLRACRSADEGCGASLCALLEGAGVPVSMSPQGHRLLRRMH